MVGCLTVDDCSTPRIAVVGARVDQAWHVYVLMSTEMHGNPEKEIDGGACSI